MCRGTHRRAAVPASCALPASAGLSNSPFPILSPRSPILLSDPHADLRIYSLVAIMLFPNYGRSLNNIILLNVLFFFLNNADREE